MAKQQTHDTSKSVRILMATYNGAANIEDQLQSLCDQTHQSWQLMCSDDGSDDGTPDIISNFFQTSERDVAVEKGPAKGFSENFMSMVKALPDECGYVAFSDQDDIWHPDKLQRAVAALETCPKDKPALYGAASWVWDPVSEKRRPSLGIRHAPAFANALIENFATGNTMLLNQSAAHLLRESAFRIGQVFAHDWLAYALVSGSGGRIVYESEPALLYRQHSANEIGAGETFIKRQIRNLSVADGRYRTKVDQQIDALSTVRDRLTPESRATLDAFRLARAHRSAIRRVVEIYRSGVFRQSKRDAAGFYAAALLGKV